MKCPVHVSQEMIAHVERVPRLPGAYNFADMPSTRIVFRCPIANCPRIASADRSFHGSFGMRHVKDYMKYTG